MKPQNFYACLDDFTICAENVLTYCEEIKSYEEGLIDFFKEEETTERRLESNMMVLGAKTREELSIKKQNLINEKIQTVENISRFIDFMKKEGEDYFKIMESEEFSNWLESDSNMDEDFFKPIGFIPAYIDANASVKVIDLLITFKHIIGLLSADIEDIIGVEFPIRGHVKQLILVQYTLKKNYIKLSDEDLSLLTHYIITFEDFQYLIDIISDEIEELNEPVRL
jgi:hypothetical protein